MYHKCVCVCVYYICQGGQIYTQRPEVECLRQLIYFETESLPELRAHRLARLEANKLLISFCLYLLRAGIAGARVSHT